MRGIRSLICTKKSVARGAESQYPAEAGFALLVEGIRSMNETHSSKLPAPLVDAVAQLLQATDLKSLATLGHNLNGHAPFSVASFLEQLFARAPESLVRSRSPSQMADIIRGCVTAVLNLPNQPLKKLSGLTGLNGSKIAAA